MAATIRIAILANAKRAKDEMKSVGERAKDMGAKVLSAVPAVAKVAGTLASVASLAGPAVAGILAVAKGVAAVGNTAVSLAPLVAFAPALIGGFQFLKFTLVGIGEEMGKVLEPLGKAFIDSRTEAAKLATKGLPELASGFQKVNLPSISTAMNRIGTETSRSVGQFGKWVNSAPGIKLIKDTTDGVASAFENAGPSVVRAAIALGNMANRAGVLNFLSALGADVSTLANKFEKWADSITSGDISGALDKVGNAAQSTKDKFRALGEIISWMADNQDKVKAISNALAGFGLVLGIVTGNPIAIAIGAFSLLINNWDRVKSAFTGASSWWSGVWAEIKATPELQEFVQTLRDSADKLWPPIKNAFDQIKAAVMPPLRELKAVIISDVVPAFSAFIAAMTPVYAFFIQKFGPVIAATFAAAVNIIKAAFQIIAGLFNVIAGLLTGDWDRLWKGLGQIVSGAWTAIKALVSVGIANVKAIFSTIGPALQAISTSAWNLVKGAFEQGKNGAVIIVKNLPATAKAALGNLGSYLYSSGVDLVRGMANGIRGAAGDVAREAANMVSNAINAARSKLQIGSPSRVFAKIGTQTGQGWINGVRDKIKEAKAAVTSLIAIPEIPDLNQQIDVSTPIGGNRSGQQKALLELRSSGSRLDDMLLELLRGAIRSRGGDVQVVLGR